MSEQELNLLKQLFESAGAIGSHGFEAIVRYTFTDGITWMIGAAVVLLLSLGTFVSAFVAKDWDGDVRGMLAVGSCLSAAVAILVILSHVPNVVEPEGTAVRELLDKATR